jgi:hypothetical protein
MPFDSVNDFRAKNKRLLDRLSAADTFINEYEPMIQVQKRLSKKTAKAIVFNLMNDTSLKVEDQARDELSLAPGKSEEDSLLKITIIKIKNFSEQKSPK